MQFHPAHRVLAWQSSWTYPMTNGMPLVLYNLSVTNAELSLTLGPKLGWWECGMALSSVLVKIFRKYKENASTFWGSTLLKPLAVGQRKTKIPLENKEYKD
jgi:hypothetical protein